MNVQKITFTNSGTKLTNEERVLLMQKQTLREHDSLVNSALFGLGVGAVSTGILALKKVPRPVYKSIIPASIAALVGLFAYAIKDSATGAKDLNEIKGNN